MRLLNRGFHSLSVILATLAEFIHSKLDALQASVYQPSLPQVTSQARLEPDVLDPHPGSTAGNHQESQALGGPDRSPAVPSVAPQYLSQGVRASFIGRSGSVSAFLYRHMLVAFTGSVCQPSLPQVTSQPRLEHDVCDPHRGSTAGYHQESQALGGPDRSPAVPSAPLSLLVRALGLYLLSSQATRLLRSPQRLGAHLVFGLMGQSRTLRVRRAVFCGLVTSGGRSVTI